MSKPKIVQGEDITLSFQINSDDGSTYDLTGTTIEMQFEGTSSCVTKAATLSGTPANGKFTVILEEADTVLLLVGTISAEALIDIAGATDNARDRRIVQFSNAITVVERICS